MLDKAVAGPARAGYTRASVINPFVENIIIPQLEQDGLTANVTYNQLKLGALDSKTGWFSKTFTAKTIKAIIRPRGSSYMIGGYGFYSRYENTAWTLEPVTDGSEIVTPNGTTYIINTHEADHQLNSLNFYALSLTQKPFATRPTTSGVWPSFDDARGRTKTWIDFYIDESKLTLDDGSQATWLSQFANPDYFIHLVLLTKGYDLIYSVDQSDAQALYAVDKSAYAYEETIRVTMYAVDKLNLTATNLIAKAEMELRKKLTEYPLGSIRQMTTRKGSPVDLGGGVKLYSTTLTIRYKRANDTYTPTDTLTWGTSTGTFTFPNIINVKWLDENYDVFMQIPRRLGNYPQPLGSASTEVQVTCDLDINPDNITWLRPQASNSKTDTLPFQVFKEIIAGAANGESYQTLTLNGQSFKVRLTRCEPTFDGTSKRLQLLFKEYNDTAGDSAYKTRWGIN
jgi:hypothetical protein